jgi:SAM-dependent methyltransferase
MATMPDIDHDKAGKFLWQVASDVGTALHGALSFIGDRLGLFKAMASAGPATVEELARKTRLDRRYLQEWLDAMTAAQYVEYDAATRRYRLPPEHALVIADETSPFFVGGFLEIIVPCVSQAPKLLKAFRSGKGVPQRAYPPETFDAIERSSATWYRHKLVQEWLPTMPDVVDKLRAGGSYADVGCGSGRAAITVAKAFPTAHIFGFDNHAGSIARARKNARAEGIARRIKFEARDAKRMPKGRFDLVSTFDVVHDAADPVGVVSAIRKALAPGGTFLMLEMNAAPSVDGNVGPIGKFLYSVSTLYCMTQSLAANGAGLGAAMGEPKARELAEQAGFGQFRRLPIDDPFSVLYELKV